MKNLVKNRKEKLLKLAESKEGVAKVLYDNIKTSTRSFLGLVVLLFLFIVNIIAPTSVFAEANVGPVLVIEVDKEIDAGLSFFIQRMIRRAEQEKASALILKVNSNGGLVVSAQEIKDALLNAKVTTVAFIDGRALSAAALISISCHKIFMKPGTEMGAATPIMLIGNAVKAAEAKFVSAFRGEFEAAAEARNRPKNLAGAMVDKNHDTIPGLVKRGEILTLTAETALKHGYCDHIVADLQAVLRRMKLDKAPLEIVKPTSAEWVARYLTNPNISVILFSIGFWCLMIEFFVPGFGIFGITGIVFLVLFFGGHFFAYLAGLEALLLFSAGVILLLAEIFVIPGFGMAGISGILAVSFSIIMVFGGIYAAIFAISKIIVLSTVFMTGVIWWGPKLSIFERFVLKKEMTTEEGFVAIDNSAYEHIVGLEGVAITTCCPSGKAKIGDEKYDVVSDGDYIEKDTKIIVRKVKGTTIVVRELSE